MKGKVRLRHKNTLSEHPIIREALLQAGVFGFGFMLSFSGRDYSFSPLGVVLVTAVNDKRRISSAVGSALGYIMFCDSINSLRYIAAILCAYILSKLIGSFNFGSSAVGMGLVSAFCILSTGTALTFASTGELKNIAGFAVEAFCGFCAAYLLKSAFEKYEKKPSLSHLSLQEFSLYFFVLGLTLWSFGDLPIPINPARIIAFYLIMLFAVAFSGIGSLIAGGILCAVFSVFSEGSYVPVCFCIGGIACTVSAFASQSAALCAVALLAVNSLFWFLEIPLQTPFMIESAVAAILFVATPKKFVKKVEDTISGSNEPIFDSGIKKGVGARLKMASSAVNEVGNAVSSVSAGLDKNMPSAKSSVFSSVTEQLCRDCANFDRCFVREREKTTSQFNTLLNMLKKNEFLDVQSMPPEVKNRCIKAARLGEEFNRSFLNFTLESVTERNRNEMRRSVADQFGSVCDILDGVAQSLEEKSRYDGELSEKIRIMSYSFGVKPRQCICKTGENKRMTIELECENAPNEFDRTHFRDRLSQICLRSFELPVIIKGETGDCITVCEKYSLAVEVGASQITCKGERLCGDSFEHFYDGRGRFDVVLSDGMGTGARAALDSSMTKSLMCTLLKNGVSPEGSVRLVNSALIVKSREESLSSVDIMQVDMFSGKAEFFKAGASPSYLRHRGKIQQIKRPALPLGILHRVELSLCSGSVSPGDIAVLVSDGVADCGDEAIKTVLKKNADKPSEKIAELLTGSAEKIRGDRHDDLTAVVCKFH